MFRVTMDGRVVNCVHGDNVDSQALLTTLATVDVPWQKFSLSPGFESSRGSTLSLGDTRILLKHGLQ